jgi:MFS family permease
MMVDLRPSRVLRRLDALAGGAARRRVVLTLAAVLALDSADKAVIGAAATQLQHGLHIGRTQIGLLLAVSSLVGAVATVPFGILVDRSRRVRILAIAVSLWGVAMLASAAATGYLFLLLAQLGLGAVTAVAGPAIASLLGDYVPPRDRARVYGLVLSGELVGAGIGFLAAGLLVQLTWRAPFLALALPAAAVVVLMRRLPEPTRGGAAEPYPNEAGGDGDDRLAAMRELVADADVQPRRELLLDSNPRDWPLRRVAVYVLRVRTNIVLIVGSALGYFFFAGVRGFAVEFAKGNYHVGQGAATAVTLLLGLATVAGVVTGGRVADRLLRRRVTSARVIVAGVAVLVASVLFVPALLVTTLAVALPVLVCAGVFLGATGPSMDAARLDIMPPLLWGRAEAVRTVLRNAAEAASPVLFGLLADDVFGRSGARHTATGLRDTFLVMLVPLLLAGLLALVVGRRTYPVDVATAIEVADHHADAAHHRDEDGAGANHPDAASTPMGRRRS